VSRNVSRHTSGAEIVANVAGVGFAARLDVRIQGDKQSVTIRPRGGTHRGVCRVDLFAQGIKLLSPGYPLLVAP
jgi:hypothetical protein